MPEVEIDEVIADPRMRVFLDYWNELRGRRFAPSWSEFDLLALGTDVIPHMIVVDVHRGPLDFIFRFWGTAHLNAKRFEKTGKSVRDVPQFRDDASPFDEFSRVTSEKRPFAARDPIRIPGRDGHEILEWILRLPLSGDGAEVDKIISCVLLEDRGRRPEGA